MKLAILFGSVRVNRQGDRVVRFLERHLAARGHDVMVVDALEYELPILQRMMKSHNEEFPPSDVLVQVQNMLLAAEGFVVVSAEYNHSLPPGLKNLLDHYQSEYFWKPSAICTYSAGSFGGVRAALHVREICAELGMPSIPSAFPVPNVSSTLAEDGSAIDERLDNWVQRYLDEFDWYLEAFAAQRAQGTPY